MLAYQQARERKYNYSHSMCQSHKTKQRKCGIISLLAICWRKEKCHVEIAINPKWESDDNIGYLKRVDTSENKEGII